jgi:hypothetical protein
MAAPVQRTWKPDTRVDVTGESEKAPETAPETTPETKPDTAPDPGTENKSE